MAFGGLNGGGPGSQLSAEINMVPLIDVMLVLLVIFMITAPMLSHSIVVDLPKVSSQQTQQDPVIVDLAIDENGMVYWNDAPVSIDSLPERMREMVQQDPQPSLRLRADRTTRYEVLAEVMGHASRAGVKGMGFVTTPTSSSAPSPTAIENQPAPAAS